MEITLLLHILLYKPGGGKEYNRIRFCLSLGMRGLSASQADILPGTGFLRQIHAHPRRHGKGAAATRRHHSPLHRLQNRGKVRAGGWVTLKTSRFPLFQREEGVWIMCFPLGNLSTQTHRVGLRHRRRMSRRRNHTNGADYVESMYNRPYLRSSAWT